MGPIRITVSTHSVLCWTLVGWPNLGGGFGPYNLLKLALGPVGSLPSGLKIKIPRGLEYLILEVVV